jgi:hypothetical protein
MSRGGLPDTTTASYHRNSVGPATPKVVTHACQSVMLRSVFRKSRLQSVCRGSDRLIPNQYVSVACSQSDIQGYRERFDQVLGGLENKHAIARKDTGRVAYIWCVS